MIAVAITLLALNLPVPSAAGHGTLAHRLAIHWPNFAAFAVSFITIGIIWINHHAMLRRLVSVDHAILFLNLMLLMCICVLPFSAALMAEYLRAAAGQHLAAVIYGGSFLVMSICFFVMQQHVLRAKPHLLQELVTPEERRAVMRRNFVGLVPYTIATGLGAVSPYATLGVCGLVAAYYAAPQVTAVPSLDEPGAASGS